MPMKNHISKLVHWARLHATTAAEVRERWLTNPDNTVKDALLDPKRFDERTNLWSLESELELARLLGALQHYNRPLKLWYRGEKELYENAIPRRLRGPDDESVLTQEGIKWLSRHAGRDRALRDRGPLARAAILQHYGCPTSLLDLSASHEVAGAFAFEAGVRGKSHLRVFAVPRHQHPVTVFDDVGVVLVDLQAELPSYCLRPHVQQAAFLATRIAVYNDIEGNSRVDAVDALLDPLCIAHLCLRFDGASRFYKPRVGHGTLYPPASRSCRHCPSGEKSSDMNGDFLLHFLQCIATQFRDAPRGFPNAPSA
jgi:FRG domain